MTLYYEICNNTKGNNVYYVCAKQNYNTYKQNLLVVIFNLFDSTKHQDIFLHIII